MRIEYTTWIASLINEGSTIWFILLYQLESDSDNERQRAAQSQSAASYLSKTMLITHPARKCVFEFLRVIMTDSLMSPSTAAKGQGVIDAILEVRNKIGISTKLPWVFTRKTRLTCIHSEEGLKFKLNICLVHLIVYKRKPFVNALYSLKSKGHLCPAVL